MCYVYPSYTTRRTYTSNGNFTKCFQHTCASVCLVYHFQYTHNCHNFDNEILFVSRYKEMSDIIKRMLRKMYVSNYKIYNNNIFWSYCKNIQDEIEPKILRLRYYFISVLIQFLGYKAI